MKTTVLSRGVVAAVAASVLSFTAGAAFADNVVVHDAWSHDRDGYWDAHHEHHAYIMHENHRGFWRENPNGTRIFVNID